VIVKIEVNEKGTNVRYVVTNFKHNNSRFIYEELYCGRGQMELYTCTVYEVRGIKELKTYLNADTMSCNKFAANQFRLFLHAAAYVIFLGILVLCTKYEVKQKLFPNTVLATASIQTIRERIILTAVHIRVLKSKIKIEFHANHPHRDLIEKAFVACALWREAA